jgi:hypothetical protein
MLEQGGRERAIAAVAVQGDVIRLGGECRERADRVLDGREALGLGDAARPPPERVVAAGVEKDQVDALLGPSSKAPARREELCGRLGDEIDQAAW